MKNTLAAFAMFAGLFLAAGCGDDAEDEIDNEVDCGQICDKYSECVTDVDVTECTDTCSDRADASENVEQLVDACESCLDDTECDTAETCWAACSLVGPAETTE